ncbi:MAG: NAD-dependent epimerase/dehydratase family protein [Candidatus Kapabacteria bacterium]|nr:NAD-dependent epimerase/dehydratase family protein [Candidatus Kapabacteria bacterium]
MKEVHLIFGTGPLGRFTAESLLESGHKVKLINRCGNMPLPPKGAQIIAADALKLNPKEDLFKDVTAIYQCSQPPYHQWSELFPSLQNAILSFAIENQTKLIVAENLYMYGNTHGEPMTENTPYNPCSIKGRVRMEMSIMLMDSYKEGKVQVSLIRGSDFFGPWEPIFGKMIFKAALQRKPLNFLGSLNQPHTFTYVKDFGKALAIAGTDDRSIGKIWHVPSGKPYTQQEIADIISKKLGYPLKSRATGKFILSFVGLFDKGAKEIIEMLYEFNEPFIMNSDAMEKTFGLSPTSMEKRIEETLEWAKSQLN